MCQALALGEFGRNLPSNQLSLSKPSYTISKVSNAAVVDIGDLPRSWLVGPVPVPALPVPVKVNVGGYHEGYQVPFIRPFIIGCRAVDQCIFNGGRLDRRACLLRVHGTCCKTGLGEGVAPVVGPIVVAVIMHLFLSAVVPPGGLIQRRAFADFLDGPRRLLLPGPLCPHFPKALYLLSDKLLKMWPQRKLPDRSAAPAHKVLECLVRGDHRRTWARTWRRE